MQTIKLGSKGEDVKKWQTILNSAIGAGLVVDGVFGAGTHDKTIDYQKRKQLAPDGIVGAKTWALATGQKLPAVSKNASADTDVTAYMIAKRSRPTLSEVERQYALSVARGEGFYGKGWKGPGVGSKNWGAVQGSGPAGSFSNVDHHADGSSYVGSFKRYNTDEEGFGDMVDVLYRGGKRKEVGAKAIKDALARGSLRDAVLAQHANGYFELDPEKYLIAVKRNYDQLTANVEWPKLLTERGGLVGRFRNWVSQLFLRNT